MENKRADISQIQKYLNGELDARAMHQLEREAQHDPFLMDALEGYADKQDDMPGALADLSRRLNQRIDPPKVKRLIPWTSISVAAGVIGFMVVAGIFYQSRQQSDKPGMVANNLQFDKSADAKTAAPPQINDSVPTAQPHTNTIAALPAPTANKIVQQQATQNNMADRYYAAPAPKKNIDPLLTTQPEIASPLIKNDSMPLDEMVVLAYTARKKDSALKPDMPTSVAINKRPQSETIKSKAEGVTITEPIGKREDLSKYNIGYLAPKTPSARLITGRVVSQDDGQPLPGVSVKVDGKNTATQTDANGNFKLPSVNDKETLSLSFIGFDTKKVKPEDSLTVSLKSSANSLNEVVVTSNSNNQVAAINKAHPQTGWQAFKRYLKEGSAVAPGKATGAVKLKFTVTEDGSITNISIIKGLDAESDKRAVDLINNGPGWISNINGKPETVTISVDFHK